jgi:O-antigen ligase
MFSKSLKLAVFVGLAAILISDFFVYRGVFIVSLIMLLYRIFFVASLRGRNVMIFVSFLPVVLFSMQFFVGFFHGYDFELNETLTKRPIIWNIYLSQYFNFDIFSTFFGAGRIDNTLATAVGERVGEDFEAYRSYTSHSLYINTLYEFGAVGLVTMLVGNIYSAFGRRRVDFNVYIFLNFLFLLGFVSPMDILGLSGLSIMFTFIWFYSVSGENSDDRTSYS